MLKKDIGKYFLECSITPFVKQLRPRATLCFENPIEKDHHHSTSLFTLSNYSFDVPLHAEDLIGTSNTREIHFCLVQDVGRGDELSHQEVRKFFFSFFFHIQHGANNTFSFLFFLLR